MKQRRSAKAKAVVKKATELYERKDYKQALALIEEALGYDDEYSTAWYYKGLLLKEFKRYGEAIQAFSTAGELDTEIKPQAFTEKGHLLVHVGCYIDAVELFFLLEQQGFDIPGLQDEMVSLRSKKGVMEGMEGRAFLQAGEIDKALINFKTSLSKNSRDKAVWSMQGEAYERKKNYKEALKSYAKSIELGEPEIALVYSQGMCLYYMKNYRKSKACFDKYVETYPNNIDARKMRNECVAAIERGESRDADAEEDTPVAMARRLKERRKKLLGWSMVFVCFLFTLAYWFSYDWRLMRDLDSKNNTQKNIAIYELGERGNKDAVDKLIKILEKDKEASVRAGAAIALGKLKAQISEVALIGALDDKDWNVRCCAAKSLGELQSKDAVVPLKKLLERDLYYGVRLSVIEAMGKIKGALAVNTLLATLLDDHPLVRLEAVKTLAKIADPSVVTTYFCELLKDPEPSVREGVAIALGDLNAKDAVSSLQEALQVEGEKENVKKAIKEAIRKLR